MPGQRAVRLIEFLGHRNDGQDQCAKVKAKLTGYSSASTAPFGKTGLLSVLVVVGGRAPDGAPAVFVPAVSPTEISFP
jgi:hypothetical protein